MKRTRVLIVDDSAIVRRLLEDCLRGETDIEVVGTAPDPFVARDKILRLEPDVVTLDIEMPRMDGLSFLKRIMRYHPLPVIIISSLGQASSRIAIEAMRQGAVDVLAKPGGPYSVGDLRESLAAKIRAAAGARVRAEARRSDVERSTTRGATAPLTIAGSAGPPRVFAVGSSTGGTQALEVVLTELPADFPPILVAQHIPPVFSASFARRLDEVCQMHVQEAADGMRLAPGNIYIAPGDYHTLLRGPKEAWRLEVKSGPKVSYQRPSVDVLFESVAKAAGNRATGVILTGMGSDGARGMRSMRDAGAHTIAQDEHSCVVFGMPREAIAQGGVVEVLPLHRIATAMAASCTECRKRSA
ncbi:MAG: chemotaxis response regulator protein-glutamate methylesterase [Bryobacterales bacterium]|jgi:two-component system chemotaxis response regulator CheB|nr:chemotaxis response regulator protein-glutamate methylesterase [Bryobacterales bacterium]